MSTWEENDWNFCIHTDLLIIEIRIIWGSTKGIRDGQTFFSTRINHITDIYLININNIYYTLQILCSFSLKFSSSSNLASAALELMSVLRGATLPGPELFGFSSSIFLWRGKSLFLPFLCFWHSLRGRRKRKWVKFMEEIYTDNAPHHIINTSDLPQSFVLDSHRLWGLGCQTVVRQQCCFYQWLIIPALTWLKIGQWKLIWYILKLYDLKKLLSCWSMNIPLPARSLSLTATSMASLGIPMSRALITKGELIAAEKSLFFSMVRLCGCPLPLGAADTDGWRETSPVALRGPPLTPNSSIGEEEEK